MELANQEALKSQTSSHFHTSTIANPVLMPIGQKGVGDDPRYGDNFVKIKNEIDKLSSADYGEVGRLCEKILTVEAKDLRVAGYNILALTYTKGLEGLIFGVECYLGIIRTFGDRCHPCRKNAKLQAYAWLNNEKISAFIEMTTSSKQQDPIATSKLESLIDKLNRTFVSMYGHEVTKWISLNSWINKNKTSTSNASSEISLSSETDSSDALINYHEILDEKMFIKATTNIFKYLSTNNDLIRLVAMTRSLKWSVLTVPCTQDKVTKINPPRASVVIKVSNAIMGNLNEADLAEMEAYFIEPGCHLYFDLQKSEVDIARSIGRADIADLIEGHVSIMARRMPELFLMSYNEGTPFANDTTRIWIDNLNREHTRSTEINAAENDLKYRIDKIVSESKPLSIENAIESLDQIKIKDGAESFRVNLAKLEICISRGRVDIALPFAEHLEKKITHHHLAEWDKDLALELWRKLLQLFKSQPENGFEMNQRINQILSNICITDLKYALSIV